MGTAFDDLADVYFAVTVQPTATPEPSTLWVVPIALNTLAFARRQRGRSRNDPLLWRGLSMTPAQRLRTGLENGAIQGLINQFGHGLQCASPRGPGCRKPRRRRGAGRQGWGVGKKGLGQQSDAKNNFNYRK